MFDANSRGSMNFLGISWEPFLLLLLCVFCYFNVSVSWIKSFCSIKGNFKQRCQGKVSCVLLKNAKLKWFKIQNFPQIAKFKCREICPPQNREINISRKFHVTRYYYSISVNMRSCLVTDKKVTWSALKCVLQKDWSKKEPARTGDFFFYLINALLKF